MQIPSGFFGYNHILLFDCVIIGMCFKGAARKIIISKQDLFEFSKLILFSKSLKT